MSNLCLLVIAVLSFSACGLPEGPVPEGKKLGFEKVWMRENTYKEYAPMLLVFTDNHSLTKWFGSPYRYEQVVSSDMRMNMIPHVIDFSEYILVAAFYGYVEQASYYISITDIWQEEDTIFVRAQFVRHPGGGGAAMNSPQDVVLVRRENLRHYGRLTFKMLDDYGKEIAETTAYVPPALENTKK